jgi:hypothetical protein
MRTFHGMFSLAFIVVATFLPVAAIGQYMDALDAIYHDQYVQYTAQENMLQSRSTALSA